MNTNKHDELLGQWIEKSAASPDEDGEMTPTVEHVAGLKEQLLSGTVERGGAVASRATPSPGSFTKKIGRWVVAAAALSIVAGVIWTVGPGATSAWAQVKAAVESQNWVKMDVTVDGRPMLKSWLSPTRQIYAVQYVGMDDGVADGMSLYFDGQRDVLQTYSPLDGKLEETTPNATMTATLKTSFKKLNAFRLDRTQIATFIEGEDLKLIAGPDRATKDGRPFDRYEFVSTTSEKQTVVCLTDPSTSLPVRVEAETELGLMVTKMTYPESGPETIYALGVPQDVEIEDRTTSPEIAAIDEQRRHARKNFDRYYGYRVTVNEGNDWWNTVWVQRLWRDGTRWRTELLIGDPADSRRIRAEAEPSAGTDPISYFDARLSKDRYRPSRLSDGKRRWNVPYDAKPSSENKERFEYTIGPAEPYVDSMVNPADPMPSVIYHPEFEVYGPLGLTSSKFVSALADVEEPVIGTAVIVSQRIEPRGGGQFDSTTAVVRKTDHAFAESIERYSVEEDLNQTLVDKFEVTTTARTPSGLLYPTKVEDEDGRTTYYFLRFDVEFGDRPFDPQQTEPASPHN